ncbi:MAG: 4Fe-4S binding protein [Prevotellaceae bacterium]|jgi:polyferredoxin|nr:4Fe-4S binding protein [Prevotellaceae bacterium]
MMYKYFSMRIIRILLAIVIILPFAFLFIDFGGGELRRLWWLTKIQITPNLIDIARFTAGASAAIALIAVLALTLLFGRIYCSVICPFGILQDVVNRIFNLGKKKRKRKKRKYHRPLNVLRYAVMALAVITVLLGSAALFSWIDPYGNFGRIMKNIFAPIYVGLNNLLAAMGINSLYHVSLKSFELFSLGFSSVVLIAVGVTVFYRGRLFCNSICPVGALLSLVSKHAVFKLRLDDGKCNRCGLCAMKCKSECIDTKNKTLDFSRCVTCYNCVDTCNKDAVGYRFSWKRTATVKADDGAVQRKSTDTNKRRFIGAVVALFGAVAANAGDEEKSAKEQKRYKKSSPVSPPGSQSIKHLLSKCTACHLCIAQCPTQVLKPAFMEYGLAGMMMPVMNYVTDFCNFECTVCSEICPNDALVNLTVEEKKRQQIGKVYFVKDLCVVYTDETNCGACSEHCPTKAVDMAPYKGSLTIPVINRDICIGCGGCEYICPVRPLRAIYVDGNPEHLIAQKPEEGKKEELELDNFGF